MCGIGLVIGGSEGEHTSTADAIDGAINCRGPDAHQTVHKELFDPMSTASGTTPLHVTYSGHVLHLRGNLVEQPVTIDSRLTLLFNGEIYNGLKGLGPNVCDTAVLYNVILAAITGSSEAGDSSCACADNVSDVTTGTNVASKYQKAMLDVFGSLRGPWSIIVHDHVHDMLWFGRDFFGRRSLVASISPTQGEEGGTIHALGACESESESDRAAIQSESERGTLTRGLVPMLALASVIPHVTTTGTICDTEPSLHAADSHTKGEETKPTPSTSSDSSEPVSSQLWREWIEVPADGIYCVDLNAWSQSQKQRGPESASPCVTHFMWSDQAVPYETAVPAPLAAQHADATNSVSPADAIASGGATAHACSTKQSSTVATARVEQWLQSAVKFVSDVLVRPVPRVNTSFACAGDGCTCLHSSSPTARELPAFSEEHGSIEHTPCGGDDGESDRKGAPQQLVPCKHHAHGHEQQVTPVLEPCITSRDLVEEFTCVLREAVRKRVAHFITVATHSTQGILDKSQTAPKVGVLFSGGIDSMMLAVLAHQVMSPEHQLDLLNVAFENKRRKTLSTDDVFSVPDRQTGILGFEELCRLRDRGNPSMQHRGINFIKVNVTQDELSTLQTHIRFRIRPLDTVLDDSIGCAIWCAARGRGVLHPGSVDYKDEETVYQTPAKILVLGMGADEQLGGYGRHRSAYDKRGRDGLVQEVVKDVTRISTRNLGRDDRCLFASSLFDFIMFESFLFLSHGIAELLCEIGFLPSFSEGISNKPVDAVCGYLDRSITSHLNIKHQANSLSSFVHSFCFTLKIAFYKCICINMYVFAGLVFAE
eukprot:m.159826 g.159826  ORF g.159826 m.159826 type:complete len:823 (+) comp14343_c0_seq3:43-2511(+)